MYISINDDLSSANEIFLIVIDLLETKLGFKPVPNKTSCSILFIIIKSAKKI
jgi:uncharacterized Fe-S cluster-containing protein